TGAWRLGSEWQLSGDRFNDAANSQRLGGYGLVNLLADYRLEKNWNLLLRANNVFDKAYQLVDGYGTGGANFFVSLRYAEK
ncbi:MAG: TonB-dependent receptor, partial [Pseudomonadota bacterium]